MELSTQKLTKKFNLEVIQESFKEKVNINQFQGPHTTLRSENKNVGVILRVDELDRIDESLDKIEAIIISECKELDDEIKNKLLSFNKVIFTSKFTKRELISTLDAYIIRKSQVPERLHATMLSIFGEGVLIKGKSSIGKSEAALELLNRKHLLIGDDAIDVISFAGVAYGKAPKSSRDFIEVRGVGIINIKGMFGIQSTIKEHKISLILELVELEEVKDSIDRLGSEVIYEEVAGVEIPKILIPVSSGRSVAAIIEAATISHKQRTYDNYVAIKDLNNRLIEN